MEAQNCVQERVFLWLWENGGFQELQQQCKEHVIDGFKEKTVYRFVLKTDLLEMLDFDAPLGNLALHCPRNVIKYFQEVCYTTIRTLAWIPAVVSPSQILVVLRFSSVPSLPEYFTTNNKSITSNRAGRAGTFSIVGVICAITGVTQYTQSARYYCPISTCVGSARYCYVRVHLTGSSEAFTTGSTFFCKHCGSALEEDATCRVLSDKCIVHILSPGSLGSQTWLGSKTKVARHQSLPIYVRDELIKVVKIGGTFLFSVFHSLDGQAVEISSATPVFEANNIQPICFQNQTIIHRSPSSLPVAIRRLYEARKESPWCFAANLAYCFGACVTRPGEYLHLKLGLLMSLVLLSQDEAKDQFNSCSNEIHRLDVLALGSDLLTLQRLAMYSASFADRLVVHSTVSDLLAFVSRDPSGTGTYMINAGCVLLASGGVCLLPNIATLKKEQKERLQKAMENKTVTVEIPKRITGVSQHVVTPVSCSVWACSEPCQSASKLPSFSWDSTGLDPCQGTTVTRTLMDRFGLVFTTSEDNQPSCHESGGNKITELALVRALDGYEEETPFLCDEDIHQFLQFVTKRRVSFTESAQQLVQGFYLAGRRTRSSQGDFPFSALRTITSIAAAHAKLSLREQVIDEDVVVAVLMFEDSLRASHGYCVLGLQEGFKQGAQQLIYPENDFRMEQFQHLLRKFCSNYSFGMTVLASRPREE